MQEETRFEDFVSIIEALHKEIRRIKAAEASHLGFRGSDVMCLYYLAKHPDGLTGSELSRLADVSRAAMSRTIAHLQEDGLVEVGETGEETSRYRVPVRLTERGREVTRPLDDIVQSVLSEMSVTLTEGQRKEMYVSLNHILDRLRGIARD